jgi:hypothetical protein
MLISARAASRILEEETGLVRQQSRRVLLCGLAGEGIRADGALLYDEARVRFLAAWPEVDHTEVLARCPGGVLVVRLGRGDEPAPHDTWQGRADRLRVQPGAGVMARAQVRARIEEHGPLPLVVTVCGYPVLLAELTGLAALPEADPGGHHWAERRVVLEMRPPTDRSAARTAVVAERRLVTSAGPAWLLLGAQPYAAARRTA